MPLDHITQENLPRFIRMSTNDIYRLRKFSTVLRIHSSAKKEGEEEYFAELQLFSPWRSSQLELWTDPEECIKEYQRRMETISIVKGKTFPFCMNEILAEMKLQETLDQVSIHLLAPNLDCGACLEGRKQFLRTTPWGLCLFRRLVEQRSS